MFNTCAVREHAEQRVFGNVGALKKLKEKNPRLVIGVCGCMAQQQHIVDKLRKSYPYVDLVFGVDGIDRLPAMLAERFRRGKRYLEDPHSRNAVVEELPSGGIPDSAPGCPSCTGATTSALTASCLMCAGGSAAANRATFWLSSSS